VNVDRAHDCIDAMAQMAEAKGVTVAQIAIAWLLHQPVVTSVIVGAKRIDQLDDNIAATQVTLNEDELAALDEVSQLPKEYPGWMLERVGEFRIKQLKESAGK
jgi:aryl-alcohol dehydrogenase-like predicted oxidoreductase